MKKNSQHRVKRQENENLGDENSQTSEERDKNVNLVNKKLKTSIKKIQKGKFSWEKVTT